MLEERKIKRGWSLLRFNSLLKCFWFSILLLNHYACSLGVGQESLPTSPAPVPASDSLRTRDLGGPREPISNEILPKGERAKSQEDNLGLKQIKEGNEDRDNYLPKDGKNLTQAQHDKNGGVIFTREEVEKRRRELKDLSPEERRERIQAWRERHDGFKSRLEFQLNLLQQKMENGTITDEERRRLSRLETVAKRFAESERRHKPKENASDKKPSLKKSTQGEKKP